MNVVAFHRMRRGMQSNAAPGSSAELEGMVATLRHALRSIGGFTDVEVEHTDDPDRLVIALCRFAPGRHEDEIAAAMERLWSDQVSYPYWEAHSLLIDPGHVEFQAATRNGDGGRYVTVHVIAQQARIPAQRVPVD